MLLSDVHVNAACRSFALDYLVQQRKYAARRLCGYKPVSVKSDYYYILDRAAQLARSRVGTAAQATEAMRSPGTAAKEVVSTLSTTTYNAVQYSLKEKVPSSVRRQADSPLKPMTSASRRLTAQLLNDAELIFARRCLDDDLYAAGNKVTLTTGASGTSWGSGSYASANSDPLDVLSDASEAINLAIGERPNVIGMTGSVATALSNHPAIKDVVKYTDGQWLWGSGLPDRIRNLNVVISDASVESAAPGAASSPAYAFRDNDDSLACAVICYVPPGPLEAQDLASFGWFDCEDPATGEHELTVRTWYDQDLDSWWVEVSMFFDFKPLCVDGSSNNVGAYLVHKAIC